MNVWVVSPYVCTRANRTVPCSEIKFEAMVLDLNSHKKATLTIPFGPDFSYDLDPSLFGLFKDAVQVFNRKGNVLDTVAMEGQVSTHLQGRVRIWLIARL